MKRMFALVFAAAALAIPAAQAHAAAPAPTAAQFKALQKQVKSLQAQVKTLQKWVPKTCSTSTCFTLPQVSNLSSFEYEAPICQQAVIADAFQATWNVIDQISHGDAGRQDVLRAQTPINDQQSCSDLKLTRSSGVPPTARVLVPRQPADELSARSVPSPGTRRFGDVDRRTAAQRGGLPRGAACSARRPHVPTRNRTREHSRSRSRGRSTSRSRDPSAASSDGARQSFTSV